MALVLTESYGHALEQALRWGEEISRMLETRTRAITEINFTIQLKQQDYLQGKKIENVPTDVYDHVLNRYTREWSVTRAGMIELATQVHTHMQQVFTSLQRTPFQESEYFALNALGYDVRLIQAAEQALQQGTNLLQVYIQQLDARIHAFSQHDKKTRTDLTSAWANNPKDPAPAPSWISQYFFNHVPHWVQKHEQNAESISIELSDIPPDFTKKFTSQILSQLKAEYLEPRLPIERILEILLAKKSYPREELQSDTLSLECLSEGPQKCAPIPSEYTLSPAEPNLLSSTQLNRKASQNSPLTLSPLSPHDALNCVRNFTQPTAAFYYESQFPCLHYTSVLSNLQHSINLNEKHREAILQSIVQAEILSQSLSNPSQNELFQMLDGFIKKHSSLLDTQKILAMCLSKSLESQEVTKNFRILPQTMDTLKNLRFQTEPIQEFHDLLDQCEENIRNCRENTKSLDSLTQALAQAIESALREQQPEEQKRRSRLWPDNTTPLLEAALQKLYKEKSAEPQQGTDSPLEMLDGM